MLSKLMASTPRDHRHLGLHPDKYLAVLEMCLDGCIQLGPFVETRPMSQIQHVFEQAHHGHCSCRHLTLISTKRRPTMTSNGCAATTNFKDHAPFGMEYLEPKPLKGCTNAALRLTRKWAVVVLFGLDHLEQPVPIQPLHHGDGEGRDCWFSARLQRPREIVAVVFTAVGDREMHRRQHRRVRSLLPKTPK